MLFTNRRALWSHNEREISITHEAKPSAVLTTSRSLCGQQMRLFVNKTRTETVIIKSLLKIETLHVAHRITRLWQIDRMRIGL